MFGRYHDPHSSVYLLADHLDAILAIGEDLPRQQLDLRALHNAKTAQERRAANAALHKFVDTIAVTELLITARLRQARLQARTVVKADPRFANLIRLFLGGTAAIVDALEELGRSQNHTFGHSEDPITFLRSRALIGEESAGLGGHDQLQPGEDMAIAGRIELRGLLDLVAAFLDSLDMAYELYPLAQEPATSSVQDNAAPSIPPDAPTQTPSARGSLSDALSAMKSSGTKG